jgi:hypothetical protein
VEIELIPEIVVTTSLAIGRTVTIEFVPEIVVTSTVTAAGTIAIEGYDGGVLAIEGSANNTVSTLEGHS